MIQQLHAGAAAGAARSAHSAAVTAPQLQALIDSVPATTEFTNNRRWFYMGLGFGVVSIVFALAMLNLGKITGALVFAAMAAGFFFAAYQHRHSGQQVFMTLSPTQLWVHNLSAPVNLQDVTDLRYKDEGFIGMLTLTLRPGTTLPTHKPVWQIFASQAIAVKRTEPQIRVMSAGLRSGGKTLDIDDVVALFGAYLEAAQARQQLDSILAAEHAAVI
ncbi:MAG: hypothetical protein GAK44_00299 [Pseudomonas delhiensis]|nr:MAG: hypothetical protein GAK44_00299 [Pseudomonas delhiensis]